MCYERLKSTLCKKTKLCRKTLCKKKKKDIISGHVLFLVFLCLVFNKLDLAFSWNWPLFMKMYTCIRPLKGTLWLIETRLLFSHLQYV